MWSAFGNGSGLQDSGGGYVSKVEGWEFVPRSARVEKERGRGESRSPLRTLSCSAGPLYEQPLPGLGVTSEEGARPQATRHELQTQHCRLKKKWEDLKKRHGQDKDDWMREKEVLLRQVADIQGGENRRILLDLKSVLEEVQLEVKREDTKRNELQLQYTKDRCAWDLERAELKCRIAQLEVRGSKVVVEASVTPDPQETLRREQEQQRRLLADTHTAAMDLRCRLEHNERGWVREKSELLERFDAERKEWESQLRDMQRKIEELYNEVKVRREGVDVGSDSGMHGSVLRLSLQSASTSSSILTDPQDLHSNSDSDPSNQHSNGYSNHADCRSKGHSDHHGSSGSESLQHKSQGYGDAVDHRGDSGRDSDTAELELILQGCLEQSFENDPSPHTENQAYVNPLNSGNDKKKNTTALNAALKEIARVSEELCSYQDVIRKKSVHKRSGMEVFSFLEEFEEVGDVKDKAEKSDPIFDLSQWCEQFQSVEEHNWVNWESTNQNLDKADEDAKPPHRKRQAPPIPPRTTSWHLNSLTAPEIDFPVPESFTDRKCHSPCVLMDRKCPSVLRKFGAMLQENEGYTLTDSGVVATPGSVDSKCNIGCCHSRWSCNGSRFGSSKSSTYVPVQKCPPDANVSEMDCSSDYRQPENPKCPEVQFQSMNRDFAPLDFRVSPSGNPPPYQNAKGPQKNETLERKTAEFNRTLFQAEMGRGVVDGVTPTEVSVNDRNSCSPQHPEIKLKDVTLDLPPQYLNIASEVVSSDLPLQHPEIKLKVTTSDLPPQYPSMTPKAMTSDLPLQYPEIKPRVVTSDLPPQHLQDRELEGPQVESNLSAFRQYVPSINVSMARAKSPRVRTVTAARQASGARTGWTSSYARGTGNTGSWVMKDQPWKPTTLAAYPRPADSRSNYGAVEKILQSYESCSGGSQRYLQHRPSPAQEDDLIELLDMLEVTSGQKLSHKDTPTEPGLHREKVSTIQDSRESTSPSAKRSFSRPARPAKRRLPSRWASRSPTAPSAPTAHPSLTGQTQTFSYSFHTETVII